MSECENEEVPALFVAGFSDTCQENSGWLSLSGRQLWTLYYREMLIDSIMGPLFVDSRLDFNLGLAMGPSGSVS